MANVTSRDGRCDLRTEDLSNKLFEEFLLIRDRFAIKCGTGHWETLKWIWPLLKYVQALRHPVASLSRHSLLVLGE